MSKTIEFTDTEYIELCAIMHGVTESAKNMAKAYATPTFRLPGNRIPTQAQIDAQRNIADRYILLNTKIQNA